MFKRKNRTCKRGLSAYLLSTGKNQEEIKDLFRKLDSRDISPVLAAKELNMSVDELGCSEADGKVELSEGLDALPGNDPMEGRSACPDRGQIDT